jgi:xylulokinase
MSETSAASDWIPAAPMTLGIDLGTSAVKIVALGPNAHPLAEGAADFETQQGLFAQAEQRPGDWLTALQAAMRSLDAAMTRRQDAGWAQHVGAIGLTGQLPTLVCLSDRGPVAPAITWKDGRADEWAAGRVDAARRADMYMRTGMPIDGRYLAPMLQFHFTHQLDHIQCILSAKDYLLSELTGLRLTEPSTAAGYGLYDLRQQRFSDELSEFWQVPRRMLPAIQPANALAGPLTAAAAATLGLRAGIPVSMGAADSVCAAYAMSGLDEHVVSLSFGSSAVIIGASAERRFDHAARYLVTPHVSESWYGREMDLLATGTGYRWLAELLGWADGDIDRAAALSVPGANGLLFPPYLAGGEQGALWNPRLKGALFGLTVRHSRNDIARAYLEGVFHEIKRCIEVLAETSPVESVRVSGNLVRSPSSLQLLADILRRPVGSILEKSPAAMGAALLARPLCGLANTETPGGPSAAARTTPHGPTAELYAKLYPEYLARAATCE